MFENKARNTISERGLADSFWPSNEDAMRHSPTAIGGKQPRFSRGMTEQHCGIARVPGLVGVVLVLLGHGFAPG
jgi:hypothetical protein